MGNVVGMGLYWVGHTLLLWKWPMESDKLPETGQEAQSYDLVGKTGTYSAYLGLWEKKWKK